jgi:small multidrug resistance protein
MSQFGYELQAHTSGDEPHQLFLFFVVKKDCTFATNLDTILMHYLYLTLAIVLEVLATTLLGKSEGFTKWLFAVGSLLSYGVCFYFLSLALKNIPLGVAYAIWSGVGIVLTAIVSVLVFKSKIDLPFVMGSLLIIAGVVVINLFSKTSGH